ncbi:MAG: ABC transporter substrate-binding protein [Chloroflexi bacterium]|nr:ABC transporter substrate-binding protein [Chloroflexota bacterium]
MRSGTPFLVCTALAGLMYAGCAPAAAPTATAPAAAAAARPVDSSRPATPAATPKPPGAQAQYGGILTRAVNRDVSSFDVQREEGADASTTIFNVYQGLVRLHPIEHEKIMPELAEKWDVSPDGKVYTFALHKGIKWHDGKPFTMEDVKYSLDRIHNPKAFKTVSPRGEGLLAAMEQAEITGEDGIRITLKYPSASFLQNIATGWVAIAPRHIMLAKGDMRKDLVGTGPFKLKDFNPNISLELERNKDYHIRGLPYLDGIRFYTIRDIATRFSAFRTGKVQISFIASGGLTATEAEIVKRDMADRAVVYDHESLSRNTLAFNFQRKPWDDVRVRRAVDLAYDRQAAIVVNGRGYVGSIYVSPWGMKPGEVVKLPGYRQPKDADIAEARRLLAEAGIPAGFKTSILGRSGSSTERQAVVARDQLAKIGIDAQLVIVDSATLYERLGRHAFDLNSGSWTDNSNNPDETLFNYYATGGGRNYGGFSDKQVDDLIEKQARTVDKAAREAVLAEIEKRVMEAVPRVISFWEIFQTGAWKEVRDFKPGPGAHPWGKLDYTWLAR